MYRIALLMGLNVHELKFASQYLKLKRKVNKIFIYIHCSMKFKCVLVVRRGD